jgi:Flp pilus assembly protein TadG
MRETKVVSRNVAIALGIICIILVVGLLGVFEFYISMINDKNDKISSLNSQVSFLGNQVNDLSNTADLNKSTVVMNDVTLRNMPNSSITADQIFDASYSGYVSVTVYSSTSDQTTLRGSWGINFEMSYYKQENIGSTGTLVFPVIASPTSWITVSIAIDFGTKADNSAVVTEIYYY